MRYKVLFIVLFEMVKMNLIKFLIENLVLYILDFVFRGLKNRLNDVMKKLLIR